MASVIARLRAVFAVLFNLNWSIPVKLKPNGAQAHYFPGEGIVLPTVAGGSPDGDGDGADGGDDGDGDGSDDADDDGDGGDGDDGDDGDDDGDDGDDGKKKDADYWRKQHRRYERTVKRKRERDKKELKEAQDKLRKREDADKSEQEKAVEKAKEEGRGEAETKAEKERKKDRLEAAVIRAAGKKIEIGEGDDAKKVRFEDPEDAEVFLQRKIIKGDLDEADLFGDDGKPKADVIAEALQEILEEKPRLAEDSGGGKEDDDKPKGGADQRKGKSSKSGDDKSVEDLVKDMQVGNK